MQNINRIELIAESNLTESVVSENVNLDKVSSATLQVIDGATEVSAKTFDSGVADVVTATFAAKAGTTAGDYIVIYAQDGLEYAIAADLDGDDPEPTGAIWTAIPAARKAQVDLTAATDAASVAAAFEVAFDALTGFTAKVTTDDTAADGTMLFTQTVRGLTEDAEVHNEDDSGAGSIAVAETTAGVDSEVDVTDNELSIPSHGFSTGVKGQLTSTGTLPAGLSLATDYFVISVDSSTIKLATSLANAQAGTAIDITDQGTSGAVNTFTPVALSGSLQMQVSNVAVPSASTSSTDWTAKGSAITISGAASSSTVEYEEKELAYRWMRAVYTHTAGEFDLSVILNLKG